MNALVLILFGEISAIGYGFGLHLSKTGYSYARQPRTNDRLSEISTGRSVMEWLIYNPTSFEILGFGASASAARENAIRNSNCLPQDFNLESWEQVDFDSDDYPNPDNWVTATQERFLEDHEQHVAATLA